MQVHDPITQLPGWWFLTSVHETLRYFERFPGFGVDDSIAAWKSRLGGAVDAFVAIHCLPDRNVVHNLLRLTAHDGADELARY